jgi:hypothetical protein
LVFTEKSRRTHVSAKKPSLRHRQGYLTDEESYLNILQCLTLTLLDQSSWIASKANDGKEKWSLYLRHCAGKWKEGPARARFIYLIVFDSTMPLLVLHTYDIQCTLPIVSNM